MKRAPESALMNPLTLRGTTFRNRAWIAPMCQYSAASDGIPNDWHLVHLGQFATGGAGLILTEATAVSPEGRLSPNDTGLWNDAQIPAWKNIVDFCHKQGALLGIQLVHAGRKASTSPPWDDMGYVPPSDGGWQTVGPSPVPFVGLPAPVELSVAEIERIVADFTRATERAIEAGFDVVEIHAAHGYLLNEFLSPLSNTRTDEYGGDYHGRSRLLFDVVDKVRATWPVDRPLFVRISATDWTEGGWDVADSVRLAADLKQRGVDLVDCSSGGVVRAPIPVGPGYQVPLAQSVRSGAGVPTSAVGLITEAWQAETIIRTGQADAVMIGRAALRQPRWPLLAAKTLGQAVAWPKQYEGANPS